MRAVATAQYRAQQRIVRRATNQVQALWRQLDRGDLTGSWAALAPALEQALTAQQVAAAALADAYLDAVQAAEGAEAAAAGAVRASAFGGIASDGRPLLSLLYQPIIDWKVRLLAGQSMQDAARGSLASALRITSTQVADAGRGAVASGMAGRRTIQGYVRVVQPPACSRCVILAGKEFGWNTGFQRHPKCDCIHLPTTLIARNQHRGRAGADQGSGFLDPRAYFNSLSAAEQRRIFGDAGARAIREGADMGQVVNARRGMNAAGTATRMGTRRGSRYWHVERRRALDAGEITADVDRAFRLRSARLMPEEIFRIATSREDAVRMLRRYGYLT
ncbi:VG15 protein [Streptomyces sp. NPDC002125]